MVQGTRAGYRVRGIGYATFPPLPGPPRRPQTTTTTSLALGALGRSKGPSATADMGCMAVSRFLKFPIQMIFSEFENLRVKSHPRARLCIEVGGYMRGPGKRQRQLRVRFSSTLQPSVVIVSCCRSSVLELSITHCNCSRSRARSL